MKTPELSPEEWIRISGDGTHGGLGVSPKIASEADYWKAVSVGQNRASALAESLCAVDPVLTAGERVSAADSAHRAGAAIAARIPTHRILIFFIR